MELEVPLALGNGRANAGLPLARLLWHLPAHAMVSLIEALLLERRILVVAQDKDTVSAAVHGAAALLYPFSWQHIYLPLLPLALKVCGGPYSSTLTPADPPRELTAQSPVDNDDKGSDTDCVQASANDFHWKSEMRCVWGRAEWVHAAWHLQIFLDPLFRMDSRIIWQRQCHF